MLREHLKFNGGGKLAVALLAVAAILGTATAVMITHTHDQVGTTEQTTDISVWAKWRLKLEAPASGLIRGVFIDDGSFNWCGGVENIFNGQVKCGDPCNVPQGWNFWTHAEVQTGIAKGWAWANESSQQGCSNPNPDSPGEE